MSGVPKTFLGLRLKEWVVFAIGIIIFAIGLLFYYHLIAINSDDVALKVLVHQLSATNHRIYSAPDDFILKVPINWVIDGLIHNPVDNVFFSTLLLNLIGFAIFFAVGKYFVDKYAKDAKEATKVFYAAFLLLCTGNAAFLEAIASPGTRTIEIGVSFGLLWFVDRYVLESGRSNRLIKLLGAIFLGLLLFSDPAFIIFLVVSLAIVGAIYAYRQKDLDEITPLGFFLVGGGIFYIAFLKLFKLLGLHVYLIPAQFIGLNQLGSNLTIGFQNIFAVTNAPFMGMSVFRATTMLALASFVVLLAYTVIIPLKMRTEKGFWYIFLALQPVYLIVSYLLSTNVVPSSQRYVILLPFYGAIILAFGIIKYRRLFVWLIILLTIGCLGYNIHRLMQVQHNHPNVYNKTLAQALEQNHLHKGYAAYWDADISTFYTGYKVEVFPLLCSPGSITPFYWQVNYNLLRDPAKQTFIITFQPTPATPDTAFEQNRQGGQICSTTIAEAQFGKPARTITVTPNTSILVYNYDLVKAMRLAADPLSPTQDH